MTIKFIDDFAATPCADVGGDAIPRIRLRYRGQDTGRVVKGAVLEAQVRVAGMSALFITYDCPFEEQLDILCLDSALALVDAASVVMPYAAGCFTAMELRPAAAMEFSFIGDGRWSVEFFDRPRWRIPGFGEPMGVWRRFGFRRRFRLGYRPDP